jgi:hypothetical protein
MRRSPSFVRARVVRFVVGCAAAVVLASCALLSDSTLPSGSQRFTPPPAYATWWSQVEQCSGRTGSYAAVSWFQIPGADQFTVNGETWDGNWSPIGNRVVLAGNLVTSGSLVRHEMLHALLGTGGHPRSAFLGACAGVVDCSSSCVAEAGSAPPPDPAWITVPPESLQVGATVTPVRPSSAVNGGAFAMTITVTNASSHGVVVALPPSGDAGPPGSFSWEATYPSRTAWYDERAWDASVTYFAPGETKRMIFDFFVNGPSGYNGLPPGAVSFRYRFGEDWQGPLAITVDP